MFKNVKKSCVLSILSGVMLFGSGCGWFGGNWWKQLWPSALTYGALEFVLDNDTVFDLLEDGTVPAA